MKAQLIGIKLEIGVTVWGSTSYSCENFRLSLALSLSRWSARSMMGIGGWLAIPADTRNPAIRR